MVVPAARYVPYYRVSTARQEQSGLGLEAQQAAVRAFVADPAQLVEELVEVESASFCFQLVHLLGERTLQAPQNHRKKLVKTIIPATY
jgi:hypothetical protein